MKKITIAFSENEREKIENACKVLETVIEKMENESVSVGNDLQPTRIETFFKKDEIFFTKESIKELQNKLSILIKN